MKERDKRLLYRRTVITALRQGLEKRKDIIKEVKREVKSEYPTLPEVSDRTVERILRELVTLRLVVYDEASRRWYWRDYVFYDSDLQYQRALEHSRRLIPSLEFLVRGPPEGKYGVTTEEIRRRKKAIDHRPHAEEHLSAYPQIHKELEKYWKLKQKLEELGRKKIGSLSIQEFHTKSVRFKDRNKWKTWFQKYFLIKDFLTEQTHTTIIEALRSSTQEETDYFTKMLEKAGLVDFLEDFLTYKSFLEIKEEMEETYRKLSGDIQTLIWKIEDGLTPLKGTCDLCRLKIKVRPENTRAR